MMKTVRLMLLIIPIMVFFSCKTKKMVSISTPVEIPKTIDALSKNGLGDNTKYGKLDTLFKLPPYDINNLPISVWFLKKNNKYFGFIVAGHATKAVCEVASLEVMTKLDEIGKDKNSIFSYGIGYNRKSEIEWNSTYNSQIVSMKENFSKLQSEYPDQVYLSEINVDKYDTTTNLIKKHIKNAYFNNQWESIIVEYKYVNQPLLIPFYHINATADTVKFIVPKNKFGTIPPDFARYSLTSSIKEIEKETTLLIEFNNKQINELDKFYNLDEDKTIYYWKFENNEYSKYSTTLIGYGTPPDDWVLTEKNQFGIIVSQRPITFKEAVNYLKDPSIKVDPFARYELESWIVKAKENEKTYKNRKAEILTMIRNETQTIRNELKKITEFKTKLTNRNNEDLIIDAFLRGWAFNTQSDELNTQLDNWYETKRPIVWDYMLSMYPNSKIEGKLAGIFHSDDVYFHISSDKQNFIITPYKIIGNDFIQVIDKKVGICQFYSPNNFRFVSLKK